MSLSEWLPLTDYSNKYKVSISTLRRRIKADDISYRLDDGKYLIIDEPMSAHQKHRPSQISEMDLVGAHRLEMESMGPIQKVSQLEGAHQISRNDLGQKNEPILTAANKLLKELKTAYTQILHEKEEQILKLRSEIADLKTLVKLLEQQNSKHQSDNF